MTRVKICCIADLGEAMLAARSGAHAIGLVSSMPSGPGVIDEDRIASIARALRGRVETFLLTSQVVAESIEEQHRRCGTSAIQIVDRLPEGELERLRRRLPHVGLVQVIHVTGEESLEEALGMAEWADHILLDSGRPDASVKELGGTGRTHDWHLSRRITEVASVPVWLAGGLTPSNVAAAIRQVRPHGVDVCSGLRPDGVLSTGPLVDFMRAVRSV
jgi:phosphoribosylanthranilate isomerase